MVALAVCMLVHCPEVPKGMGELRGKRGRDIVREKEGGIVLWGWEMCG